MKASERFAIPPVSLDAIPGLRGDERGGDHDTVVTEAGQLPGDLIAAGTGLVAERQQLLARA